MARTFKDAQQQRRERRGEATGDRISTARDAAEDQRSVARNRIVIPTPDDLTDTIERRRQEDRQRQVEEIKARLDDALVEDFGKGLSDIEEAIRGRGEVDYGQLEELALLENVADSLRNMEVMETVLLDQLNVLNSIMDDVARAVESPSSLTISGTNTVDEADIAEEVVPESEDKGIPAREVWVRAAEDNDRNIYIGDDDVEPKDGWMLKPGEWLSLKLNYQTDELYMASEESGQTVQLLGAI